MAVTALPAYAAKLVTYSWTTTSEGFGPHVSAPTTATFQAPLSDVQAGKIPFSDITNIDLAYPGLTFDNSVVSSDGFDFAAFVNPTTGAFVFHDDNQGLGVIAFAGSDINSATTFLSITVDGVAHTPSGQPLPSVADQYNALNDGSPFAGFPTAGFWTATFPLSTNSGIPEPAAWAMMILGLAGTGFALRRRRNLGAQVVARIPQSR